MAQFRQALASFCAKEGFAYDESLMIFLESSTDAKFSFHVIGKWIAFRNNFQAGQFVERAVPVVDTSVYSRNRCFRVLRQSKFGKSATLELQDGGIVVSGSDLPHFQVLRTLASFVPDGTSFCDHSKIPMDAKHENQANGVVVDADENMQNLLNWLCVKWDHVRSQKEGITYGRSLPTQVSRLVEVESGKYWAILVNNRFCLQRERSHKNNAIFFYIDMSRGIFSQKCFDHADCAGRSASFKIPREFLRPSSFAAAMPSHG